MQQGQVKIFARDHQNSDKILVESEVSEDETYSLDSSFDAQVAD